MTIKEKGYSHWDGEFLVKKFPWWPITRYGIKLTFMRKLFKFTLPMSLLPAVFFLTGIYISERIEDFPFLRGETSQFLEIGPRYFNTYFTQGFMLFIMLMIVIFCGANLISDDLKHNSLQLYFSRPLKKKDYFFGKNCYYRLLLIYYYPDSWPRLFYHEACFLRQFQIFYLLSLASSFDHRLFVHCNWIFLVLCTSPLLFE